MITNFHDKKMPKRKSPCKCLSIIMLDSVIKANKKYHPQTFLEECRYVQENARNLEKRESDSDSNDETESDIDNDEFDE